MELSFVGLLIGLIGLGVIGGLDTKAERQETSLLREEATDNEERAAAESITFYRHPRATRSMFPDGRRTYERRKRNQNEEENHAPFCEIESSHTSSSRHKRDPALFRDPDKSRSPPAQKITEKGLVVEIAVFADNEMWKRYSDMYAEKAEEKLKDFVATAFANIQYLYDHPTISERVKFKIVHYEVFKYQPYELRGDLHQDGDAQMYLDAFCMYQYKLRSRTWDQSFIFTGYDMHRYGNTDQTVSGLARLGGACDSYNSCVLVEGHDFTGVFVGAHEIGHGFGMRHDDTTCAANYLMSGLLGPGKTSWSTCSAKEMTTFIDDLDDRNKNCLRLSTGLPEALPLDTYHTPGQRFDGDQQCVLMYGDEYQQFLPREDFNDGPCAMSWCGKANFSRVITAHPALEGTYCGGDNKYCSQGRCTQWSTSTDVAERPRLIHGGWSAWSRFACTPCYCAPFTGSLGVIAATRACTDPKPQNGGAECPGLAVRGLVCDGRCPPTGDTVRDYIKRKCETTRTGVGKEDALTGEGVQMLRSQERACKVFCAVRSQWAWYRFYGDLLPDGTPCGNNKHCVGGTCLKLLCDNTTLAADSTYCPPSYETCTTARLEGSTKVYPTGGPTTESSAKTKRSTTTSKRAS